MHTNQEAIIDAIQERDINVSLASQACQDLVTKGDEEQLCKLIQENLGAQFEKWHLELAKSVDETVLVLLSDQTETFNKYCTIFPKIYAPYDQH